MACFRCTYLGIYCPAPVVTPKTLDSTQIEVRDRTLVSRISRLRDRYWGILYTGLMAHPDEMVSAIEFNLFYFSGHESQPPQHIVGSS
jgi:phosphoribosylamine-glycine ligase